MFKKIMMSLVLAALAAGVGWADIPAQINFQGRLTDASGAPLTAATTLSFQIFDVVSGGTPLWTGTTNVGAVAPDKNGVFNLIIGQDTSNGSTLGQLPFDKPYWVEVLVGSPAVSLGRQPLTATPYAITAKNVYGGTGYFSGGVGIGTTSPSAKLHLVADTAYSDWSGSAHGLRVASGLTTNATSLLMGADESQSLAFLMSVHPATPKNPMGKLALNPLGGNVGISTAAPAYTLDVQGDINFNGRLLQGGEEVSLGGSKWGSSGSDIYYTGGKVGIGTASPAAKLNIDPKGAGGILIGNSAVTGNYTSLVLGISANESGFSSIQSIQRANGSVPGNLLLNPSGGSVGIGMNNTSVTTMLDVAGDIWARGTIRAESFLDNFGNKIGEGVWKTNGSNIYNSNSGNVGIGTANVVAKLDLGGSLAMNDNGLLLRGGSDASHMLRFYSSYAGLSNYDTFTYDNGFAFLRGAAPKLVLNSSGNVGIGTTSPKAKLAINSQVYNAPLGKNYEQYSLLLFDGGAAASSYGLGIEDFHVGFHSNGGYKFYKQGREMPLLLIGDNIGVGTTSPSAKLHLVANTAYSDWSGSAHGLRVASGLTTNATSLLMGADESQSLAFLMSVHPATPKNPMGKLALNPLGGNVGISTAAPAYTLDVQGDINFNGRLLKGGNEVSLGGPQWSAASGSGIYYTGGKVGIGTASPNSNSVLTIADSAYPALSLKDAGTGDYGQLAAVLSNGYYSAFAAKNDVVLRSNAGSLILTASNIMGDVKIGTKFGGNSESVKMIVKSDGKVGVGTMDPGQKLEVNGSVYVNAETSGFIVDAAGNKRVGLMKYQGTEGALTHGNTTALRFGQVNQASVTGGSFTEQMRIDNSGNVGINTTDPKSKLSIIAPNTSASNGEDSPHGLIIGSGTTPSSDYYLYMGADRSRGYSYIQSVGANYYRSLVLQGRGGTVAIGDPASASAYTDFKLWVGGKAYGNEWKTPSDARWKKNVAPLKNSLQKVVQLRGVNYDWRVKEFPKKGFAEGKQAGLIAQEVEKVIPEIVSTDSAGYKSLAYDRLTAYLVEAVKELKAENDGLKARLAALEGKSK